MNNKEIGRAIQIERQAWTTAQIANRFKISFGRAGVIVIDLQNSGGLSIGTDRYNRFSVL